MSERAAHINRFLRRNQAAARLLESVERDARLLKAAQDALAAELRPHCRHATLDGGRIWLLTDGPVWASRLRFAVPGLLAALCAEGLVATEVRIRIVPAARGGDGVGIGHASPGLSQATVAHLKRAAAAMDDDALAAALLRLSERGTVSSGQETARGRGP